jgi:hypothetical protein
VRALDIDRKQLLPRSGVDIVAPWLIVAPDSNTVVGLDLRLIDLVEVCSERDEDDELWLNHDARSDLVLTCGDLAIAVYVADGPDAVEHLVAEAATITGAALSTESPMDLSSFIVVGGDPVLLRDDFIHIGDHAFRVDDVRENANKGGNLTFRDGRRLQAAIALLVVAAAERSAGD